MSDNNRGQDDGAVIFFMHDVQTVRRLNRFRKRQATVFIDFN
jgi:hypothetical protein